MAQPPMVKAAIAPSRPLGNTESNWCKALHAGTGITVVGILFQRLLLPELVRAAICDVVASQPLLRAWIIEREGRLWFDIRDEVRVDVELRDRSDEGESTRVEEASGGGGGGGGGGDGRLEEVNERWLEIVEEEMNTVYPAETPYPTLQLRLYYLPSQVSLVIIRPHPAACDVPSGAPICSHFLSSLRRYIEGEIDGQLLQAFEQQGCCVSDFADQDVMHIDIPSVEDAIPPGHAKKSFWAHGIDVIGYGLVSRRHAYIPFDKACKPSRSRLIRSVFPESASQRLLEVCKNRKTDLYGILIAAALKAVATLKRVGSKGEHYGVVGLLNCRGMLQPQISESTVGFYHSALMKTIHATEHVDLWELAARCSEGFDDAIKNRKHFSDMDDLNMLMMQAISHPNLTPYGSMRSALLSTYHDPAIENLDEAARCLNVKDCVTSSSIHGVGPCLAIFPFLSCRCLKISYVYCTPLFCRSTIQTVVDSIYASIMNVS